MTKNKLNEKTDDEEQNFLNRIDNNLKSFEEKIDLNLMGRNTHFSYLQNPINKKVL